MIDNLVKIVIPIYKTELSDDEFASLNQCVKLLGEFPIVFIQPKSLDSSSISFNGLIHSETFDDSYFKSVMSYNSLLLSSNFYERFEDSEYILIYQLDAYVFKNDLKKWCSKDYDYIGAPWLASPESYIKKTSRLFYSKKKKERESIFFKVGNGGFSLRRVSKSIKIANHLKKEIKENLERDENDFWVMEDVFWSIKVPEYFPHFKIPDYKEAISFAIDRKPEIGLKLNNNNLPFGCHGFNKPKVVSFWKNFIKY